MLHRHGKRGADVCQLDETVRISRLERVDLAAWADHRRGDKPFSHKRAEKETLAGTRGGEEGGIAVHSVRLPGFVADQEVIFGLPGQTLTIAHRKTSREAYVPGVLLAVAKVTSEPRFFRALDELLGLP